MNTKVMEQFNTLDTDTLTELVGGKCTWGGLAGEVISGAVSGAVHTKTWQGAAIGAAGYGVLYGATCWW
ncbi:TPA: Blp family class II bacteriocin [Streptococcus suis]|nr:Blp family class II bacteriocin [Streptococcus suis]